MAVYRFKDVRGFEAAIGKQADFMRFTLTPALAVEWLGLSSAVVSDLVERGNIDAVVTEDGHTFLDADQLEREASPVAQDQQHRRFVGNWLRSALSVH
jgi:hypothetical protein